MAAKSGWERWTKAGLIEHILEFEEHVEEETGYSVFIDMGWNTRKQARKELNKYTKAQLLDDWM